MIRQAIPTAGMVADERTLEIAPYVWDEDEMNQLAAEQAEADRIEDAREHAAECALWHRRYSDGSWSLDEWMDNTGQTLADFMAPDARVSMGAR